MIVWCRKVVASFLGPSEDLDLLTADEVAEALRTENRAIVNELYSLVLSLYNGEADRMKALDTKAAALFGFVGAVVSAIFVVLSLLSDPKNTVLAAALLKGFPLYALIVVLALLTAALIALFRSVVVKKAWKHPGARDLFEAVQKYDGHVAGGAENADKSDHDYKRHLIEHFWKMYCASLKLNEAKAVCLYRGQWAVFLGLILLVTVQITAVLAFRGKSMSSSDNSNSTTSAPAAAGSTPPATPEPSRPPALAVSSQGTQTRDGNGRPPALDASSNGGVIRNSSDRRPERLEPSSRGVPRRDNAD